MTEPASAPLGSLDGWPVRATSVAITNAGDGLSTAMKTDPVILHSGDTVYVVLECEVGKITFVPVEESEGWKRQHQLKAGVATIIDAESVKAAIDAQRELNVKAAEAAKGVQRLPIDLVDEHDRGEHTFFPTDGCPDCEAALNAAAVAASPEQIAADELAARRKGDTDGEATDD
jgi:hypothetical protein